jgi:hypothetical protein
MAKHCLDDPGHLCLLLEELCQRLSVARRVYLLNRPYESIVGEVERLIAAHQNPVFVIENCFDLTSERLRQLIKLFSNTTASLVLTSRSISARAEVANTEQLSAFEGLAHIRLSSLVDIEVEALIRLSDQIAGWTEFPRTHGDRKRFVCDHCKRSLPTFLLELLNSEFVRDRYAEEYRKTADLCSGQEISAIVAALYVANIGYDPPVSFLSNIFHVDLRSTFDRFKSGSHGLYLARIANGRVKTVPSIGARNILRDIVPIRDRRLVVDTVIGMLRGLSDRRFSDDFERHIFMQLMRYSILTSVVEDDDEINRFFDNISKIDYCRRQILFWLQWHMAMADQGRFELADTYLKRSYTEAEAYEKRTGRSFDRVQLDDRKAKFLMARDRVEPFRETMIYDLKEACQITERILRRNDLTHHPFDTFTSIADFFAKVGPRFNESLRELARKYVGQLGTLMESRVSALEEGYPTSRAAIALERFRELR